MKSLLLIVTACSALVVAYFVTTVVLRPMASAEATPHAAPPPAPLATQPQPEPPKLTALLPDAPGFYNLQLAARTAAGKALVLPCRLFLPREYDKSKDLRPLLVFLHGEEQRGFDLAALSTVGPEKKLREDQGFRDNYRSLVVSPQCPKDATWDDPDLAPALMALVDEISRSFRIDPERISLTGMGMGASGACGLAALQPDRFCAIALSAPKSPLDLSTGQKLKHLFSYVVAPQNDKAAYETYCKTIEALGKAHAELQPRLAGNNVKECTQWFYSDNGNYDWINQRKRRTAEEKKQRDERDTKALADAFAAIPKTPGEHKLRFSTWVGDKKIDMPYQLYLPRGYDASPATWPAILFLCGAGEVNPDLSGINSFGPCAKMRDEPKFREWFPGIVISPIHDNSPERARAIVELLEFLEQAVRIDPDRVTATGLSLGGTTCWTVATAGADKFAAIAPISGRERCIDVAPRLLKYMTTWIIVGGGDGDFTTGSQHMYDAMLAAGDDVRMSVVPGEGHGTWPRYFQDRRFYDWLFQQHRLAPAERAARDRYPATAPSQMLAQVDKHPDVIAPGQHWLEFATRLGGKPYQLRYSLYLPSGYDPKSVTRWPLMLCLHHDELRSTDQSLVFMYGSTVDPRRDAAARTPFPMIGLAPQLPDNRQWTEPEIATLVFGLLDDLQQRLLIDAKRVYLTGHQSGGTGAWAMAIAAPERFAAIAPFQGNAFNPDQAAKRLVNMPARVMAPQQDGGAVNNAKQMVEVLRKDGAAEVVQVIVPDNQDPSAWLPYYTDPELVQWLMQHRR